MFSGIFLIILLFFAISFCFITLYLVFSIEKYFNKKVDIESRYRLFQRFTELLTVQDVSQKLAYDKIYQEDIFSNSNSKFRFNKEEVDKLQRKFIKLTLEMCGQEVVSDLYKLHGSYESLCLLLAMWFVNKLSEDELKILSAKKEIDIDSNPLINKN